jgi:hypothetical protein
MISLRSAQFFKVRPPNLKSWIHPWLMHIQLKNRLWTTVAFLHCCNLIWGLANNNYSLYFLQFLTDSGNLRLCYILYIHSLAIYYIVGPLSKLIDIVLLLKITQIWVITICVVLAHSKIIFQKEKGKKGGGGGVHIQNHWYARLQ